MRSAYGFTIPEIDPELTRVGPGTPCGEMMRRYWQPVCLGADLTDLPKRSPHPRRGPGGVPGRARTRRAAVLSLQPPGHLPGVRASGGRRAALLLPRLALRRGGTHPRHAAGTAREHREGPSLAPRLPGARVRRTGVRLHGSAGQDAAPAALRLAAGGRRHAQGALRPPRGRSPELQLASRARRTSWTRSMRCGCIRSTAEPSSPPRPIQRCRNGWSTRRPTSACDSS